MSKKCYCPMMFAMPAEFEDMTCRREECMWYFASTGRCAANMIAASTFATLENEVRSAAGVLSHHSLLVIDDTDKRPGETGEADSGD